MIFTEGVRDAADAQGCPLGEAGVAEAVRGISDLSAEELVAAVREAAWTVLAAPPDRRDRTVLVVKRQRHRLTVGASVG